MEHLVNGRGKQNDYWAQFTAKKLRTHEKVLAILSFIWRSRNPFTLLCSGKWLATKDDSSPTWFRGVSQMFPYSPMTKPDTDLPNPHSCPHKCLAGLIYPHWSIKMHVKISSGPLSAWGTDSTVPTQNTLVSGRMFSDVLSNHSSPSSHIPTPSSLCLVYSSLSKKTYLA